MRIGITDSAAISGCEIRNSLDSGVKTTDLAELELSLGSGDTMRGESSLGVVEKTESLVGPLNRNNV